MAAASRNFRLDVASHEEFRAWTPSIGRQHLNGTESAVRRGRTAHPDEHLLRPGPVAAATTWPRPALLARMGSLRAAPPMVASPMASADSTTATERAESSGSCPRTQGTCSSCPSGPVARAVCGTAKILEDLEETLSSVRYRRNVAVPSGCGRRPGNGGRRLPGRQGATVLVRGGDQAGHGLMMACFAGSRPPAHIDVVGPLVTRVAGLDLPGPDPLEAHLLQCPP